MSSIKLSVVIPCFNAERTIRPLLEQLRRQTIASDQYEVLAVDDDSTDDTRRIIGDFPEVILLQQSHRGPGEARNLGTVRARGSYVLYLDSDLCVPEDLLQTHLEFHLKHPEIAATGGSVLPAREWRLFSWALVDHLCSWFNAHPGFVYGRPPEYLPSLNFCINRKFLLEPFHLRWEAGLHHTGEDVVFCHSIRQHGLQIAFVPEARVKHWDRQSLRGHLRHMVRWGAHAPFVRGRLPGLRYGFLFPRRPVFLVFTVPAIVAGYTFLIWKSWLKTRPVQATLSIPQILLGRMAYAWGVVLGTLQTPPASAPERHGMNQGIHNDLVRSHFDSIASDYVRWKGINGYYHNTLLRWCRSLVPPGRKIVDVGCGRGDVLAALEPREGTGIDLSAEMVRHAAAAHPALVFRGVSIEEFDPEGECDAVLCINTLEYTWDVGTVLDKIHSLLRGNGRVLITTGNPIWSPVFRWASRLGLRIPECTRLFLTSKDLENMLGLHGFDVVDSRMALALPKFIPGVSPLLNWIIPRIPVLRLICSTQLIAARKVPPARADYSVSIIVPCHNEAGNVERCIKETRRLGRRTELIFVDDGSTDETAQCVRPELNPDLEVQVIRYSPNRGKAHAVRTGFDAATGDILMVLDADLTTHPAELQPLYEAFASGRAEFVNCTRFVYPQANNSMRMANYIGNKVFAILVSWVMEARVSDTLCGTKAMFRWDYAHMTMGRDPWGDYDFLFGAAQQRLVIRELPVHYRERMAGISKMKTLRHTLNLFRMCWHGFGQVKTLRPLPPASRRRTAPDRSREGRILAPVS